jgi:hypothetical protein
VNRLSSGVFRRILRFAVGLSLHAVGSVAFRSVVVDGFQQATPAPEFGKWEPQMDADSRRWDGYSSASLANGEANDSYLRPFTSICGSIFCCCGEANLQA